VSRTANENVSKELPWGAERNLKAQRGKKKAGRNRTVGTKKNSQKGPDTRHRQRRKSLRNGNSEAKRNKKWRGEEDLRAFCRPRANQGEAQSSSADLSSVLKKVK